VTEGINVRQGTVPWMGLPKNLSYFENLCILSRVRVFQNGIDPVAEGLKVLNEFRSCDDVLARSNELAGRDYLSQTLESSIRLEK
jgi:hypothetical protein